jgi:hypothetical protein
MQNNAPFILMEQFFFFDSFYINKGVLLADYSGTATPRIAHCRSRGHCIDAAKKKINLIPGMELKIIGQ